MTKVTVRFVVRDEEFKDTGKYRVEDKVADRILRGRFHTRLQAIKWIEGELERLAKAESVPQTGMRGRARAHLLTRRNYAEVNEAIIAAVGRD